MKPEKASNQGKIKQNPNTAKKKNINDYYLLKSSETIFNHIGDGIIIFNTSGVILSINTKAEKIIGRKKSEIINKNVSSFFVFNNFAKPQQNLNVLKEIFNTRKKKIELKDSKLILSRNKFKPVKSTLAPILNGEGKTSHAAIILDPIDNQDSNEGISLIDSKTSSEFVYELPGFIYRCANDKNWTMKFISDGCRLVTGYKPAEFIENKKIAFNDIIHPDYRKSIWKKWQSILKVKQYFEFEYPIITKKKEIRWVWERGKGIYSDKGKLLFLEGFITDITERKNSEAMLLLKNTVFESSISGNSIADIKGNITNLNAAFLKLWGYSTKSEVRGKHISDFFDDKKTAKEVIKALNNEGKWEGEFRALRKDGSSFLAFALATPVHDSEGKKIGYQSSVLDITERKTIEQEVEKNRVRMQLFVEGTPHLFFYVQNLDGYVEYISPSVENITGYKVSEWLNQRHWFITDSPINQKARSRTHQHLAGEVDTSPVYAEIKHAKGGTVTLEMYERPILKNGKVVGLQGVAHDITERLKSEEKLRSSELSYQKLFDSVAEAIYIQDENGVFLDVNEGAVAMYGYDKKTLIGKTPDFVSAPDRNDIPSVQAAVKKAFSGEKQQFEFWGKRKNGEEFLKDVRLYPAAPGTKKVIIAIATDITERTKAERLLKESEARYKLIAENTADSIAVFDFNLQYTYLSPSVKKMLGYSVEELKKKGLQSIISPADALYMQNLLKEELKNEQLENIDPYRSRTILSQQRKKDGSLIWVEGTVSFIRDSDNRPIGILAVSRDVTERVLIEAQKDEALLALKASEEKYRTLAENINDALYSIDRSGRFTYISSAVKHILGYDPKDVIGRMFTDFVYTDDLKLLPEQLRKIINDTMEPSDYRLIEKSGAVHWVRSSGKAIYDKGNLIGFQGVMIDINKEKIFEQKLKFSEERYRIISNLTTDYLFSTLVDESGNHKMEWVAGSFEKISGYSIDEYMKIGGWRATLPAEELVKDDLDLERLKRNLKVNREVKTYHKNGSIVWVRSYAHPLWDEKTNTLKGVYGAVQDITEQKMNEESMRMMAHMLDIAPNAISVYDFDGRCLFVNQNAAKMHGYTIEEYKQLNLKEIDTPSSSELINDRLNQIKNAGQAYFEVNHFKKDGTEIPLEVFVKKVEWSGIPALLSIGTDITERKKTQQTILENEQRLRALINSTPDIICFKDGKGRWLEANEADLELFNLRAVDYKGKTDSELAEYTHPIYKDAFLMCEYTDEKAWTAGGISQEEEVIPKMDGTLKIYDVIKVPLFESDGSRKGLVVLGRDITERRKAIDELKAERDLFSSGPVCTVIWAPDENWPVKYVSSNVTEVLGYTNEFLTKPGFYYSSIIHPEDLPRIVKEVKQFTDSTINTFEQLYRIRHKNGNYLWIYDYTKFVRDEAGDVLEIKGYLIDQTNLKNAQQEIENQKQRLTNIIEGTNVGTWEWNVQTGETIFNERWAEIIGYSLEELKPVSINTWFKVVHPDDLIKSEELLMKHFKGDSEYYECELRVKHRDGRWLWITDKGKVVSRTYDNKPLMMFGTHQDITERKRAEILQNIQYKVADAAVTSIRLTDLFESIRVELATIMNVNNFFIALYDEKTGMLNSDVDRDEMEIIPEWPAEGSMTGYVIEQKRSVIVSKNQINHMIADGIAGMVGIIPEIWLGVPFRIGGKVIGVIVVQSYDNPNAYDHNSVEILEIVAHELSIFIQHKRAEEETQKLSKAIIQSPASIIITDPHGKIEYVNPKFTEVSGYSLDEIKGETPRVLRSDEHGTEFFSKLWDSISSGNDWQGEIKNRKKNGDLYWEAALISPILNEDGRITNYLAINEDITEKKKMIEELIVAKEKAEEMNRVKSNFFANMSHELRTPMVGILGFSEMLMNEFKDNPEQFTMIKSINSSGQRLLETLNMILNISKLEAAKVDPVLTVTNIVPLVQESYQFFESAASRKNLKYELKIQSERILCKVDSFLFLSIINNLINNAIKFTSTGAITLSVKIIKTEAIIRVSDSGVGISQEKLNLIWEEFRQASEGYNRSFEGTGLGLTISKRYTELMNGKIDVESIVDKGTTFVITFPIVEEITEQEQKKTKADQKSETIKVTGNTLKILYVEDDDVSIKLVRTVTKGLYEIDSAKDSDEALALIEKNKYGLILMDINLHKGMDGIELTQLIRKKNDYKEIPIVALTAFAMGHEKEEFLAKGMTHYLSKPFSRNQLLELLHETFKQNDD